MPSAKPSPNSNASSNPTPKPGPESPDELRKRRSAARRRLRERAAQRQILLYAGCVLGLGGLYWYAQGDLTPASPHAARAAVVLEEAQKTMLRESVEPIAQALDEGDRRNLERQRGIVRALARRHVGASPLGGSLDDLRILQALVDERVLARDQVLELQALGVVLGDVLAEQLDLDWIVVDDEHGRSRALRWGSRDDFFFPITMISKRYAKDIPVDVAALYRDVEEQVAQLRALRRR